MNAATMTMEDMLVAMLPQLEASARKSNAAARKEGWFTCDWGSKERLIQRREAGRLGAASRRNRVDAIRPLILSLIGDDWRAVTDIAAEHREEFPNRSVDAIRGHCRDLEVAGKIEGRVVRCPVSKQMTKHYRRAVE